MYSFSMLPPPLLWFECSPTFCTWALYPCFQNSNFGLNDVPHYPQWDTEARTIKHQYVLRKYVCSKSPCVWIISNIIHSEILKPEASSKNIHLENMVIQDLLIVPISHLPQVNMFTFSMLPYSKILFWSNIQNIHE